MKNKRKILIIILLITICALGYIFIRIDNSNMRGVVIKAEEKSLTIMDVRDEGLYYVFIPENNKLQFKQGQEILVYFNDYAIIEQTNPAIIGTEDIEKIRILKEKSNVEIPRKKLERVYSTDEKVLITIDELSLTGISITINDTNEFKREYEHSNAYIVSKKESNGSYNELEKNTNIKTTINSVIDNKGTIRNTYNWENIYGKLDSGEYQFKTSTSDHYINIFIDFSIDENGKITYSKPKCGLIF
ncbi:MAG: hypothetical protein HFJ57_00295 [Clostridia bacterium]|nr:hypothetical protein [Clostridia bacterium]